MRIWVSEEKVWREIPLKMRHAFLEVASEFCGTLALVFAEKDLPTLDNNYRYILNGI